MRVLMVTDVLCNGGAERQLALLASSLPEGWTASVLSMADGPYRPVLEDLGVEVRVVPRGFRFDVGPAARMWRAAASIAPDVVHCWGWMSGLAMVPFCRLRGIPLLNGTIRRGNLDPERGRMERFVVSLGDAIVANSRAGLAAYGFDGDPRGRVVYNGFDCARLLGVAVARAGAPREGPVAIMAARMRREKDWQLLLAAARTLAADEEGWRFVAVGDGPDREVLLREAADLTEAGVLGFPDGGLEVLPMVAAADIGVLLTDPRHHAEGCSNSILEYMACALPVVATRSGGNGEIVEDGVTGVLVPPWDEDALVEALRSLRQDRERARAMGTDGRRRLEERFTTEAMVAGFVDAYEALTSVGRRA